MAFIGNTDVSDEKLAEEGESYIDRIITNKLSATQIVRDHPYYHAYTNNCQNFVMYLLAVACPGSVTPRTIKTFTTRLITTGTAKGGTLSIASTKHQGLFTYRESIEGVFLLLFIAETFQFTDEVL